MTLIALDQIQFRTPKVIKRHSAKRTQVDLIVDERGVHLRTHKEIKLGH